MPEFIRNAPKQPANHVFWVGLFAEKKRGMDDASPKKTSPIPYTAGPEAMAASFPPVSFLPRLMYFGEIDIQLNLE